MLDLKYFIIQFMNEVKNEKIDIYNEFSFQHELGIYLRNNIDGYKIEYERNVTFFEITNKTIKKEIDISIFNENERYAIELKYPRNGQYPEEMFSFVKDIKFMEELKQQKFNKTFCLTLVDDHLFYRGDKKDGIYKYFRSNSIIKGKVNKPTGEINETIVLNRKYQIEWRSLNKENSQYYLIEISE